MDIIDAQLHLPRPWSRWSHGDDSYPSLLTEVVLAQMDAAGVDAAVLVSHPVVAPADWCRAATALHPGRLATVLTLDETASDIAGQVARTREEPGVLGIRLNIAYPPDGAERLRAGAYEKMLSAAERHRVPVCVLAPGALPEVGATARRHPELPLLIEHMGLNQPPLGPADEPPWRDLDRLLPLAGLPNVFVKLSGAPTLSDQPYPYPDVWPYLRGIIDAFGADRCMWATDQHRVFGRLHGFPPLPRYPGYHSYAQGLHYLLDRPELSASDRTALFGGTTRRIMGWPSVSVPTAGPSA